MGKGECILRGFVRRSIDLCSPKLFALFAPFFFFPFLCLRQRCDDETDFYDRKSRLLLMHQESSLILHLHARVVLDTLDI